MSFQIILATIKPEDINIANNSYVFFYSRKDFQEISNFSPYFEWKQ